MVHVVAPAEGEVIQMGPIRLRIVEDGSHTDHRVALVEGTLPPGSVGPPQHIHLQHDETFHVVSGMVRFTSGGEPVDAGPGTTVTAPIGVPHTFGNPGDVPAVFVCTLTPDLYVGYFRELSSIPWGAGGPDPAAVGELMSRYATELA
jgi:mannose-6-phosphate isomerase-like protein (cupin superfamily)